MTEKIAVLLTQKEKRLVEELRRIKYGEVVVVRWKDNRWKSAGLRRRSGSKNQLV